MPRSSTTILCFDGDLVPAADEALRNALQHGWEQDAKRLPSHELIVVIVTRVVLYNPGVGS